MKWLPALCYQALAAIDLIVLRRPSIDANQHPLQIVMPAVRALAGWFVQRAPCPVTAPSTLDAFQSVVVPSGEVERVFRSQNAGG